MQRPGDLRRVSILVDYIFGRGTSRSVPKSGLRLVYSRRSGRLKLVFHSEKLFATVKPSGSMALSLYGASILAKDPRFKANCVQVDDSVAGFVQGGRSVFCKFVRSAGSNIFPKSEVAVVDSRGRVLGVGTAVMSGVHMTQFKTGVAVKVRDGVES